MNLIIDENDYNALDHNELWLNYKVFRDLLNIFRQITEFQNWVNKYVDYIDFLNWT